MGSQNNHHARAVQGQKDSVCGSVKLPCLGNENARKSLEIFIADGLWIRWSGIRAAAGAQCRRQVRAKSGSPGSTARVVAKNQDFAQKKQCGACQGKGSVAPIDSLRQKVEHNEAADLGLYREA